MKKNFFHKMATKLVFFTLSVFILNTFYFSDINADLTDNPKFSRIIENDKWIRLDSEVNILYFEFLDGQKSVNFQTNKEKFETFLKNKKIGDENEKTGSKNLNFSKIVEIKKTNWIKVKSKGKVRVFGWLEEENDFLTSNLIVFQGKIKDLVAKVYGIRVISREEWGADENLRYVFGKDSWDVESKYNVLAKDPSCNLGGLVNNEKFYKKEIYKENGKNLVWPFQYSSNIKKIAVHHTAESDKSYNLSGKEKIRSIYKYHALTRGWGDVGYHYLIDKKGNIYEGRKGGDYVVGGHARCHNIGSIGISLMGHFQNQYPTISQLNSLAKLISSLGKKYNIKLNGQSYFHHKLTDNILGHRQLTRTLCPGDNLFSKIPSIKKQIELKDFNFELKNTTEINNSLNIADLETNVKVIEMAPTSSKIITFTYKNTGTETWNKGTWLYAVDNNDRNLYTKPLFSNNNYVVAHLKQDKVLPGGIGNFTVEIKSGYSQGLYSLEFIPIINGLRKFTKGTIIQPIKVTGADNSYVFLQLKAPPKQIYAGQTISAKMKLRNTGNTSWFRSGKDSIKLKSYPLGKTSGFVKKQDGYDPKILATLQEESVKPGDVGTFNFDLKAPFLYGDFYEKFIPVIGENITVGDRAMQFNIEVLQPNYRGQLLKNSKKFEFLSGEKKSIRLGIKNISDVDLEENQVEFKIVNSGQLKFNDNSYTISDFIPKGHGAFANLVIQAPRGEGEYFARIQALANGKKFEKLGRFDLKIVVKTAKLFGRITYQSKKTLNLKKGQYENIIVRIRNKTNSIWENTGINKISLISSNHNSPLKNSKWTSSNVVGTMKENKVPPGGTATFKIPIKSEKKGLFTERFFIKLNSIGHILGTNFLISANIYEWTNEKRDNSFFKKIEKNHKKEFEEKNSLKSDSKHLSFRERIAVLRDKRNGNYQNNEEEEPETNSTKKLSFRERLALLIRKRFQQNSSINQNEAPKIEKSFEKVEEIISKNEIKVKLSFPHKAMRVGMPEEGKIFLDGKNISFKKNDIIWTRSNGNFWIILSINGKISYGKDLKFIGNGKDFIYLENWHHFPSWNTEINDNFYRGNVRVFANDDKIKGEINVINELSLENYMKGIAEVPEGSSNEKRKALSVISRSYAAFYIGEKYRKFPGKVYDGSDSPDVFQKYLGAGYERRSPKWQKVLKKTSGEVLFYKGEVFKSAYFSCSNGKTKTLKEAGWQSNYFKKVEEVYKSVNDEYGKDMARYDRGLCGHGVGLSGFGAERLAQKGWSYRKILHYYYDGIEIEKMK